MFYCNIFSYFVAIFSEDKEIKRLVKDVEDTLETIPQLKSTFSLQAEIDLAIQPLRSENAQLRRFVQEITVLIKCCKRFFCGVSNTCRIAFFFEVKGGSYTE